MKNVARREKSNVINFPSRIPDPRPYTADDLNGWRRIPDPQPDIAHWLSGDCYYNPTTGEMKLVGPSGETKFSSYYKPPLKDSDDPRPYIADDGEIDLKGWLTGGDTGYMFYYDPNTSEARVVEPSGETAWIIQRVKGKEAA